MLLFFILNWLWCWTWTDCSFSSNSCSKISWFWLLIDPNRSTNYQVNIYISVDILVFKADTNDVRPLLGAAILFVAVRRDDWLPNSSACFLSICSKSSTCESWTLLSCLRKSLSSRSAAVRVISSCWFNLLSRCWKEFFCSFNCPSTTRLVSSSL